MLKQRIAELEQALREALELSEHFPDSAFELLEKALEGKP